MDPFSELEQKKEEMERKKVREVFSSGERPAIGRQPLGRKRNIFISSTLSSSRLLLSNCYQIVAMDIDQEAHLSTGIEGEVEAGANVRNQLTIWDTLIEWRIILQKLLVASNQLPQPTDWRRVFGEKSDSVTFSTQSELKSLLNAFLDLQDAMVENNCDLFDPREDEDAELEDDEEIVSDLEDDEEISGDLDDGFEERENGVDSQENFQDESEDGSDAEGESSDVESSGKSADQKRKLSKTGIEEALHERSEYLKESRDKVLDEWFKKTRFSSTNSMKQSKSMDSFEQPPSTQIQQILSNQKRLIKRTQLKRSNYGVIGKETTENEEYDCEIFDDDDFYHQLLRELIDSKTSNDSDSLSVSRKWLEIQKMRSKMKKKVDTRASKGRKIRFDVHKQLINFMAPIITHNFTEEAKDELFDSLFQTS